jgi:hypothetical protein
MSYSLFEGMETTQQTSPPKKIKLVHKTYFITNKHCNLSSNFQELNPIYILVLSAKVVTV